LNIKSTCHSAADDQARTSFIIGVVAFSRTRPAGSKITEQALRFLLCLTSSANDKVFRMK
jgi:hypothetical protein